MILIMHEQMKVLRSLLSLNVRKTFKNYLLFQGYLEFFTRKEVVCKLLEVLKSDYPTVSYHVVDHKVSKVIRN